MPRRRARSSKRNSRRCSELVEVRFAEGVALVGITGLVADREPVLSLFRRAVRPRLGAGVAGRLSLNPVVAPRRRRRQRVLNVLVAQRFQIRHPGALLLDGRRVVRPHPGIAVGLQLGAHAVAARALRALLGTAEYPLQVLHVMAELVGNHILLRQWSTAGTELGP